MSRVRCSRATKVVLSACVAVILAASAAADVKSGHYTGHSKQKLKIDFHVANGKVSRGFYFLIDDACPDADTLEVRPDSHTPVPAMKIDKSGRFGGTFGPASQPTRIQGQINAKRASGSIDDKSVSPGEHGLCHGHTSWSATTK